MGSGSSIQCPKNFDRRDFAAILRLHDELDANNVAWIAEIHASSKLSALGRQEAAETKKKTLMTEDAQRRLNNEISAIKSSCNHKIQSVTTHRSGELTANQKRIDAKVDELRVESKVYETSSALEKRNLFLAAVSKDNKLSFPLFFKHVRNHTDSLKKMYPHYYSQ